MIFFLHTSHETAKRLLTSFKGSINTRKAERTKDGQRKDKHVLRGDL